MTLELAFILKGRNEFIITMNKAALVEAVMKETGMETKVAAAHAVEAVFDTIVKTLGRGEEVAIAGFGTFRVAKRAAREGRNPKTGEKIQIKASIKPKFRAGKLLKEAVM
jgi:DNA-binding protein HU-beta